MLREFLLFSAQVPWAGEPGVGLTPLASHGGPPQISVLILNCCTMGVGPDQTTSLYLLPSMWFLYIFSYKESVQLNFRWFSAVAVLYLVVILMFVGGGEIKIYLLHHLDPIPQHYLDLTSQDFLFLLTNIPLLLGGLPLQSIIKNLLIELAFFKIAISSELYGMSYSSHK